MQIPVHLEFPLLNGNQCMVFLDKIDVIEKRGATTALFLSGDSENYVVIDVPYDEVYVAITNAYERADK